MNFTLPLIDRPTVRTLVAVWDWGCIEARDHLKNSYNEPIYSSHQERLLVWMLNTPSYDSANKSGFVKSPDITRRSILPEMRLFAHPAHPQSHLYRPHIAVLVLSFCHGFVPRFAITIVPTHNCKHQQQQRASE